MTIKETLQVSSKKLKNKEIISAELDAEIILGYVLKKPKEWLYANLDKQISFLSSLPAMPCGKAWQAGQEYKKLILRRLNYEPIAYIIGKKEFYGLDFLVNKNVLIPRPETEILVNVLLYEISKRYKKNRTTKSVADNQNNDNILDIGTGSGCIAISILKKVQSLKFKVQYYASDISNDALKIAKQNAKIHKVENKIKFIQSDLFEKFPRNITFDIIVANLPYLDKKILSQSPELKYEPCKALYGGKDGLEIYKKFFKQAKKYLNKNSKIFIEINPSQTKKIKKIISENLPKSQIKILRDLTKLNRVIIVNC